MPQLSLYIDNDMMGLLRTGSQREGISLSKYGSQLIRGDAKAAWPHGFWDVYGSLDDDTFVVPDELDFALDGPRSEF